ncbi:glycosyltransferase family 1 protein [Corynebacterium afermentans subsp. lipophilum]|uniref:glycosyltransferase family 4 protein n=1 Tax=Corynebacterium afermentans TaxID=38286 RepID=UPI00188B6B9D|nr:glycosyltransferase family 1 protein [Corynebacterium afermentans]MBF4547795.1 glycosyltransferase family 1 protein [Corynebacterium afermentans subsp. lipophilum]WJY58489.1 GDP-mannose-dependent alpha-mannosyltransferase [Corynebacterium afermentans subsp. lipophilum]
MRIALLTEVFLPKIDGVVTRTTRHLDQLAALGHEVLIFAPGNPPAEYAGFEVVPIRSHSLKVYPEVKHGMLGPKTYRRLREFNPDVVHAVNPIWTAGWSTLVVARRYPVVASFHTDVPEYCLKLGIPWVKPIAEWGLRTFHGRAGLNMVTSGPMMDKAADYGIENVRLWPKAVDTESFTPAARTREMRSLLSDGHPDDPLIIFVGRISAEKSVDRCIPIVEEVRKRVPNARLAFVGEGPLYDELRANPPAWATFTGYLSGADLSAAYASGDVLLFPSTTETLGFAALEAFASGVPVVAAKAGGLPFVVADGETGVLVDPEAPDAAWADPIERILTQPELRERMSAAGRAEAERWTWRASTETVLGYYDEVIRSAGR